MLIILQIWERSVISPNQGVASLVSPKEGVVNVIYPFIFYLVLFFFFYFYIWQVSQKFGGKMMKTGGNWTKEARSIQRSCDEPYFTSQLKLWIKA